MERNHNEQQIVMSIEHYQNLLGMADRNRYTTKRIEQHVRKFNPFLQAPHQARVKDNERQRCKYNVLARKLVAKYAGKTMYAKAQVYANSDQFDPVYAEVIVRRVSPQSRMLVEVFPKSELEDKYKHYCSISVESLRAELPDDYIPGVGSYHRYMVKANGDTDQRAYLAEQERRRQERDDERRKEPESEKKMLAFDVITER